MNQVAVSQLCIVDGAWQEAPDNLAVVDEAVRGMLFVLVDVAGEPEGRDALALCELVETARREYSASHGSITAALTQAVRAANAHFFSFNFNTPPQSRRIGGIAAVVLRQDELFIAQGGPGVTCVARGLQLQRYPAESPWFDPGEEIGPFLTPGAAPLGLRSNYTPDLFRVTLQPGDAILLSTRTLVQLLSNTELLDTLSNRHPDEIVESLEEVAGAADLSAIVVRLPSDPALFPVPSQRIAVLDTPVPLPSEPAGGAPPETVRFAAPEVIGRGLQGPEAGLPLEAVPDEDQAPAMAPEESALDSPELLAAEADPFDLEDEEDEEAFRLQAEEEAETRRLLEEEEEEALRAHAAKQVAQRRMLQEREAETRRLQIEREAETRRLQEQQAEARRLQAAVEAERRQALADQARERQAQVVGGAYSAAAGLVGAFAGVVGRIDLTGLGTAVDRALSALLRLLVQVTIFAVHAFLPGTPDEHRKVIGNPGAEQVKLSAWRLAAILFPVVLLGVGGSAWVGYRQALKTAQDRQLSDLVSQTNSAIEAGKKAAAIDKAAARVAFQKAVTLAQQAQKLSPSNPTPRSLYYQAQDLYDGVNGISVLFSLPKFATFTDSKSSLARIVTHLPDVFLFDRGAQRVYRYTLNDTGTNAAPAAGDGVILKPGDKIGERTAGDVIDMLWIDAGRLVVLDRSGQFLQYDPVKSTWTARAATDGDKWSQVTLAASYVGNLYLLDASKNQIWKYVATAEGVWSSSVSYLTPGLNVDLAGVVDMAIDGDVWMLRSDGSIWRFSAGKLVDFVPKELDLPLSKPTALFTMPTMVGLYVADAGNKRIVQFDKVTGKFIRQFKPRGEARDVFDGLKVLAADETSKKFVFTSGNQAYLANIPQ